MTFYVIDPLGYRLPYSPDDFRVMRRGAPAQGLKSLTDRRPLEWPKPDLAELPERGDTLDRIFAENRSDNKIKSPLLARQVMSRQVTYIPPETTLREAWELMAKRRFRHLPVVQAGKLVGVISDRRLAREMINRLYTGDKKLSVTVGEIMVTPVLTATPLTPAADIAQTMILQRIGCMPVLDEDALAGILTRSDLLRIIVR